MFAEEAASFPRSALVGEVVPGCVNPAWSASEELGLVPFKRSDPVNKVTVTLRDDLGWCVSTLLYNCILNESFILNAAAGLLRKDDNRN